jgi:hypothetical protein
MFHDDLGGVRGEYDGGRRGVVGGEANSEPSSSSWSLELASLLFSLEFESSSNGSTWFWSDRREKMSIGIGDAMIDDLECGDVDGN